MKPNLEPLRSATRSSVALAIGLLCMSTGGGEAFAASPEVNALQSVEQAKVTVKGIVLDENGDPVIGASVVDASGKNGTVTDANGNFSLEAPKGTTLKISYLGYNPTTIAASTTSVRVVLQPSNRDIVKEYMSNVKALADLKPEKTNSAEVGLGQYGERRSGHYLRSFFVYTKDGVFS